jgi:hypothetical protein
MVDTAIFGAHRRLLFDVAYRMPAAWQVSLDLVDGRVARSGSSSTRTSYAARTPDLAATSRNAVASSEWQGTGKGRIAALPGCGAAGTSIDCW